MIDKEVKQTVINIFDDVDELMSENGFNRRKNGLVYSRTIGNVKQRIELIFSSHRIETTLPSGVSGIIPDSSTVNSFQSISVSIRRIPY